MRDEISHWSVSLAYEKAEWVSRTSGAAYKEYSAIKAIMLAVHSAAYRKK